MRGVPSSIFYNYNLRNLQLSLQIDDHSNSPTNDSSNFHLFGQKVADATRSCCREGQLPRLLLRAGSFQSKNRDGNMPAICISSTHTTAACTNPPSDHLFGDSWCSFLRTMVSVLDWSYSSILQQNWSLMCLKSTHLNISKLPNLGWVGDSWILLVWSLHQGGPQWRQLIFLYSRETALVKHILCSVSRATYLMLRQDRKHTAPPVPQNFPFKNVFCFGP